MNRVHPLDEPEILDVGGHRVEVLPQPDSHKYCCWDCAGHADDLDAYRHDDCDKELTH